ncbi:uncharacterized protein TNCV_3105551 [Trichonephila clavipes]|nr:uncharacterized protein TNCV_3105551 [Trichonephila clavipes]
MSACIILTNQSLDTKRDAAFRRCLFLLPHTLLSKIRFFCVLQDEPSFRRSSTSSFSLEIEEGLGLDSNPREDMDVCKCIVSSWHGGALNSRRAASPLVRLVEGEERWKAPDPPLKVFSLKIGMDPSKIVLSPAWCLKLRLTTGVRILALSRDEFRGL